MAVIDRVTSILQKTAYQTQRGVGILRGKGINISNNATLPAVIDSIDLLSGVGGGEPVVVPEFNFDPLIKWEGKNILELWEDDPRKDDWTYRAIYVINGAFDSQNFKANTATVAQRNALAFETSDGVFYEPSTDATLVHNWDTSQDIIDSNGNPVRYVKVYSNVAITPPNTPYFYNKSKYVIYGLNIAIVGGVAMNFFYAQRGLEYFSSPTIETIDFTGSGTKNFLRDCASLKYVSLPALISISGSGNVYILSYNYSLTTISLPALISINGSNCILAHNYSLTTISLPALISINGSNYIISYNYSLTTISLPALTSIRGSELTLSYNYSLIETCFDQIINFSGASVFRFVDNYSLKTFSLPPLANIGEAITLTNLYGLEKLLLPSGWNSNVTFNTSTQMSREAIVDVINAMADRSSTTALIVNMGASNLSKLTPEDIVLATAKNITLS